ncbi:MAG TPA: AI-2E family transporter [Opitutaceae bacterium]
MNENPECRAAGDNGMARSHLPAVLAIAVTVLGLYLCFRLAAPFLAPIAWALALAVVFLPLQRWLEARLHRPSLSALLTVGAIIVIVFLPLVVLTDRLVAEASQGATAIKAKIESGEWERAIESHPRLAPLGRWITEQTDLPRAVGGVASWLAGQGASLIRGSIVQVVGLALTFYFLFFFLRDRKAAHGALRTSLPLSTPTLDGLWQRIADTIHATIFGTVIVAIAQGVLGGLMFWLIGLPSPLLWGVVMAVLALVPLLGPFLIWVPAAIYLAAVGSWGKALLLTLWGAIAVGGIDNLLRPILVGNRLKMHTLVMFVAVLGGLSAFGPDGLVWGPVIVTSTMWLLETWRERNGGSPAP